MFWRSNVKLFFAIGLIVSLLSMSLASAQTCPADRTPLEMAGHRLCLLNAAMPKIQRWEDGLVHSLVWDHPERFPPTAELPPGTFYLIVEMGEINTPSLKQTQPSELPELLQVPYFDRTLYYSQQFRIDGQPFWIECNDAIAPHRKSGAQDCKIDFLVASGVRAKVYLGTVDWVGPAWPRLDALWVETWPPNLSALEAGISNLLSIQQ